MLLAAKRYYIRASDDFPFGSDLAGEINELGRCDALIDMASGRLFLCGPEKSLEVEGSDATELNDWLFALKEHINYCRSKARSRHDISSSVQIAESEALKGFFILSLAF